MGRPGSNLDRAAALGHAAWRYRWARTSSTGWRRGGAQAVVAGRRAVASTAAMASASVIVRRPTSRRRSPVAMSNSPRATARSVSASIAATESGTPAPTSTLGRRCLGSGGVPRLGAGHLRGGGPGHGRDPPDGLGHPARPGPAGADAATATVMDPMAAVVARAQAAGQMRSTSPPRMCWWRCSPVGFPTIRTAASRRSSMGSSITPITAAIAA
jgi:hypothetical protein